MGFRDFAQISEVKASAIAERAISKAELSHDAVAIEPGKYTVILERMP